jgi:hypothetical protein
MVELARPAERGWTMRAGESVFTYRRSDGEVFLEVGENHGEFSEGTILEQFAAADNTGERGHAATP